MSLFLDQTFASTGLAAILFGIVGLGCVVSWPLLPSRRGALMVQGTGACAFALHFALIGAPTASAACVLSLMQRTHPARTAATDGSLRDLASYLPRKASTPS